MAGAGETAREAAESARTTLLFAVLYASVSSTLGIANKWALLRFPYAGLLTAAQFGFTALVVLSLDKADLLQPKLEGMKWSKLIEMVPITCVFYMAIFSNTKILQFATVELFIAFRSATPIFVCLVDTVVRKQPTPSLTTALCLLGILVGAIGFAAADTAFNQEGYIWACVYLCIITTEMVYAKHVTKSMGLTTWGLVLYQNVTSLLIWPVVALLSGEARQVYALVAGGGGGGAQSTDAGSSTESLLGVDTLFPVFVTCVLGAAISFAGWGTRSRISATSFTVLGVACKVATVGMNLVVWEQHSSMIAQMPLLLCILASVAYNQSAKADAAARAADVEAASKCDESDGAPAGGAPQPKF